MICMKCKKQFSTPEDYEAHVAVCQIKKKDAAAVEDLNEKIRKLEKQNKSLTTKNSKLRKQLKELAPDSDNPDDSDNDDEDGNQ